jgi:hypothetical protein
MTQTLLGGAGAVGTVFERALWALIEAFVYFFVFVVILAVVRRTWIAVPVTALLIALQVGDSLTPTLSMGNLAFSSLVFLVLLVRFGFVAGAAYLTAEMFLFGFPVTSDMKSWYARA